jgi:hypothetical protein
VFSSWREDGKPRGLRRELTNDERAVILRRRDELEPAVAPYQPGEVNLVAMALAEMFDGFPSMRQSESEAAARIDVMRNLLKQYPLWAIQRTCRNIQERGYERDGKIERHWPPADSEVVGMVQAQVDLYAGTLRSAVALLEGKVDA